MAQENCWWVLLVVLQVSSVFPWHPSVNGPKISKKSNLILCLASNTQQNLQEIEVNLTPLPLLCTSANCLSQRFKVHSIIAKTDAKCSELALLLHLSFAFLKYLLKIQQCLPRTSFNPVYHQESLLWKGRFCLPNTYDDEELKPSHVLYNRVWLPTATN